MVPRDLLVAAAVVAALAVVPSAGATAASAFHTPGWVAQCYVPVGHESPMTTWVLACHTPDDGFTISMGLRSRPRYHYHRLHKGYRDRWAGRRLLGFDRHWAFRAEGEEWWHCVSRRAGLLCWNRVGHGWWLDRDGRFRTF